MASEERNALAELANELTWIEDILRSEGYGSYCDEANKARRIIAKLAKVAPAIHRSGKSLMYTLEDRLAVMDAVDYCRAVAEEGGNNAANA